MLQLYTTPKFYARNFLELIARRALLFRITFRDSSRHFLDFVFFLILGDGCFIFYWHSLVRRILVFSVQDYRLDLIFFAVDRLLGTLWRANGTFFETRTAGFHISSQ